MTSKSNKANITGGLGHGWDGGFTDGRLDAPTFHRNHEAIRAVVEWHLGARQGTVLEVGAGTGQHVAGFARAMPNLTWQPSDPDPRNRTSIDAWRRESGLENIEPAIDLDVSILPWQLQGVATGALLSGIFCSNVVHIAPWSVTSGLFEGAAQHLAPDAPLLLYGPFMKNGEHTAPSNAAFDAQLKSRDPVFGLRDIRDLIFLGEKTGLHLIETTPMPANNLTLVFERGCSPSA